MAVAPASAWCQKHLLGTLQPAVLALPGPGWRPPSSALPGFTMDVQGSVQLGGAAAPPGHSLPWAHVPSSAADLPYDLRPGQRCGTHREPHWDDAPALPLGRLPAVPGAYAAGLPPRLLGVHQ